MKINYKGHDSRYNRMAEIWYDDESEKERYIGEYITKTLKIKGWNIQSDCGYIFCEVSDREEFENFSDDYKELKKSATLRWKVLENKSVA